MGKTIAVTSGKGGVGKTLSTISMAAAAKKSGARVLIVDADLGLSNVDILMGIQPAGTLKEVLDGQKTIRDIISRSTSGIDIISSGTGITQLANMSPLSRSFLVHELKSLPEDYDYVFLDTGAGISEGVLALNSISDLIVVITTPEPHAVTDAYALIKVMGEEYDRKHFALIVNQCVSLEEGIKTATKLNEVSKQFLDISVQHVGSIQSDRQIFSAILNRRVGAEGTTSSLCGQGWSQSWCQILQILNSTSNHGNSGQLTAIWNVLSETNGPRQFLDL